MVSCAPELPPAGPRDGPPDASRRGEARSKGRARSGVTRIAGTAGREVGTGRQPGGAGPAIRVKPRLGGREAGRR